MKINVLLFGSLTEITGQSTLDLETERIENVAHLHTHLLQKYPDLAGKTFQYAVNQSVVSAGHPLSNGDEVALLPPFSGG